MFPQSAIKMMVPTTLIIIAAIHANFFRRYKPKAVTMEATARNRGNSAIMGLPSSTYSIPGTAKNIPMTIIRIVIYFTPFTLGARLNL